jgi:uncharacterized protein (TIGR03085 family)
VSLPTVLLRERRAFCDTLDDVGPDGPSLCEGWTATDVAAHVQATESLAGVPVLTAYATGVVVITTFTKVRPWAQAKFTRVMEREKARGFDTVVARLRNGPPLILRIPLVGDVRLCEEWVHHEDIRRAKGDVVARSSDPELESHLWRMVVLEGLVQARRFGRVGVEIADLGGRRRSLSRGSPKVRITGAPGELLLWVLGRQAVAEVKMDGPVEAVKVVAGARLGL